MITIGRTKYGDKKEYRIDGGGIVVVITEVDTFETNFHPKWEIYMYKQDFFQATTKRRVWFSNEDKIFQLALDIANDLTENKLPTRIYKVKTRETV